MLALTSRADASTLYASAASGGTGELYILNQSTGAVVQDIGPLNDATGLNYGMTGLAFNPLTGVMYGSTHNLSVAKGGDPATVARLVKINPATAQVTVIGQFNAGNAGTPATMTDLAFDAAGKLYGIGSVGGPQLYSINEITGQATVIGNSGLTSTGGGGLAISPSAKFYATPTSSRFGTYNSATGVYTNIATPTKPVTGGSYAGLGFDAGVLYGIYSAPGSPPPTYLVTFDPVTGVATSLGTSANSLDAIAFQVPEPAAFGLLAIGVTMLLARRRHTKA